MTLYAGLTIDQLKQLVTAIEILSQERNGFQEDLNRNPDKFWGQLGTDYCWSNIYTYSFLEHLRLFYSIDGLKADLAPISEAPDSQTALAQGLQITLVTEDPPDDRSPPVAEKLKQVFCLLSGLVKTYDSILYYGLPLDVLVKQAADGDDRAFFKSVRIDRSITACPPIADRIARAETESDETFFNKLALALKGKPKKPADEYGLLRYFLYLFNEDGTLDQMTMVERYEVLCVGLRLYPVTGDDPARSLQTFIQRWRKTQ